MAKTYQVGPLTAVILRIGIETPSGPPKKVMYITNFIILTDKGEETARLVTELPPYKEMDALGNALDGLVEAASMTKKAFLKENQGTASKKVLTGIWDFANRHRDSVFQAGRAFERGDVQEIQQPPGMGALLGVAAPKIGRWIKADGTSSEVIPEKGKKFSLEELQKMVGGYVERLKIPGGVMIADEEGLLKNLPVNEEASQIAGQTIVGDVVVLPRGMGW